MVGKNIIFPCVLSNKEYYVRNKECFTTSSSADNNVADKGMYVCIICNII